MRIQRIDLIRYGKFTGRRVELPQRAHDIHVIVGPNEAGKSTLRSAIVDMLYGLPMRSAHAFLHPLPELRLGGLLEQDNNILEFHRVKANKQTLRTPQDAPLTDGALGGYLGNTDREFFLQMFSLDHERLVKGGAAILSASSDLGQILFQSAAGIASLGDIREALETEAGKLWGPRKAGDRAYYQALEAFEAATKTLKDATVRAKDWSDAQSKLAELDSELVGARQRHTALKQRRGQLNRVLAVKPFLLELDQLRLLLDAHAHTPSLPESSATTLADAEQKAAVAASEVKHHAEAEEAAQTALAALHVERNLLDHGAEIVELNNQRLQYRAYPNDIARRQAEVDAQWQVVAALVREMGWADMDEKALRARMPTAMTRSSLAHLIARHGVLQEKRQASQKACKAKARELDRAQAELDGLPAGQAPVELVVALTAAQSLGDFEGILRERETLVAQRKLEAESAQLALHPWQGQPETLRSMAPPSRETIQALVLAQNQDEAETRATAKRVAELEAEADTLKLDIKQLLDTRHPVTREEVLHARQTRDKTWTSLKLQPGRIVDATPQFEREMAEADALADNRHDTIQDASTLQAKQVQRERTALAMHSAQSALKALRDGVQERQALWELQAQRCGLPPLSFQSMGSWFDARSRALELMDALTSATQSHVAQQQAIEHARAELSLTMQSLGMSVHEDSLRALMVQAETHLNAVTQALGQRQTVMRQIGDATRDLESLRLEQDSDQTALDAWTLQWTAALEKAGFAQSDVTATVESSLQILQKIDSGLDLIRKTRVERIETMRADLAAFEQAAKALAEQSAADLAAQPPEAIAQELDRRLRTAQEAEKEHRRLRAALEVAKQSKAGAQARVEQANAAIQPMFERTGAATHEELRAAISASDECRQLLARHAKAEDSVRKLGEGMSLDALRTESDSIDATAATAELSDLDRKEEDLLSQDRELSAAKQDAKTRLSTMAGSTGGAIAEAKRQEALAGMVDAVEQYVRLHTAGRLLRWSIEQYRELKQGPMLETASRIFARLTLGSFERLSVDFESEPPKLLGRRQSGESVGVDGLSDGTRDQLYLALRLAALDLHLAQSHAMPFIADDLFINYDDARSKAGLEALGELSTKTQVVVLTHHDHLLPAFRDAFGRDVNVVEL
ncbi:MAG: AAA family ATPase [Proteobacteria bacterium]|nr:AAA family ATPase [Pseudomonadota bacterium]